MHGVTMKFRVNLSKASFRSMQGIPSRYGLLTEHSTMKKYGVKP